LLFEVAELVQNHLGFAPSLMGNPEVRRDANGWARLKSETNDKSFHKKIAENLIPARMAPSWLTSTIGSERATGTLVEILPLADEA
jgi:hypothetical protein